MAGSGTVLKTRFVGAKGGAGVWQRIISEMPPHELYIEAFAGTAQVLVHKRPSTASIAIDSDENACAALRSCLAKDSERIRTEVVCADAVLYLHRLLTSCVQGGPEILVYCDPPYLFDVRKGRSYYEHEFGRENQHVALLSLLQLLAKESINVMVSGYRHKLYDFLLGGWRRVDYQTRTRGGKVTESLWCSFPSPRTLHDWRFAAPLAKNGDGGSKTAWRQRERLKRKKARWLAKLREMSPIESGALLAAISEWKSDTASERPPLKTSRFERDESCK